ncbi:MAG: MBL fold metallo-hydrolase [Agarilytica sp.]
MRFASLGSGSSGNATLVQDSDTLLLVDCGFTAKETELRMQRLDVSASQLNAIVVTHEHSDHIKGVGVLARKHKVPVYMTEGTFASKDFGVLPSINIIKNYQSFEVGSISVEPIVVPHDAREPAQYVFCNQEGVQLGVLTDLGSLTPHIIESFQGCDGLLVEANHDIEMLAAGPYPPSLKSRVASPWGHLNNCQTADFLAKCNLERLQEIVVGHISQKNNSLESVKNELDQVIALANSIHFACQDRGFDWLQLKAA